MIEKTEKLSISNQTRHTLPRVPFLELKEAVLGKEYELSIALVGSTTSRKLNKTYRSKDAPTNVLSFPLSKNEGEIVLDLAKIKTETKKFDRKFENLVAFLFIHGLFHLKGMDHGVTMENKEASIRKRFFI
jgi:rRNA maturation RNase YbeY